MTCPRMSVGEEAPVPQEFLVEDDLHREEATAAEDTANATASQTLHSTTPSYGCLRHGENNLRPDYAAGNFVSEAEDERRRLEGISLGILNDPSANLSNVPRISPVTSPGRYSWASRLFPAGRYPSSDDEKQEKTLSCKSPTRHACHGVTHHNAGRDAIKRLAMNVDRLSGLVEVLHDHCKSDHSYKEMTGKTTQAPEEVEKPEPTTPNPRKNEANNAEATQQGANDVEAPQEVNEAGVPQAGFFDRIWNQIRAAPGALFGTIQGYLNGATTAPIEPETSSDTLTLMEQRRLARTYWLHRLYLNNRRLNYPDVEAWERARRRRDQLEELHAGQFWEIPSLKFGVGSGKASEKRKAAKRGRNERRKKNKADKNM